MRPERVGSSCSSNNALRSLGECAAILDGVVARVATLRICWKDCYRSGVRAGTDVFPGSTRNQSGVSVELIGALASELGGLGCEQQGGAELISCLHSLTCRQRVLDDAGWFAAPVRVDNVRGVDQSGRILRH